MDLPIKALTYIVILFVSMLFLFDINRTMTMKQTEFESSRLSNESSLSELISDYENRHVFTENRMFEEWIINFIISHDVELKQLNLVFTQIQSEPPLYLVKVEGFDDGTAIINSDVYTSYISGAMILEGN